MSLPTAARLALVAMVVEARIRERSASKGWISSAFA